MASIQDPMAGCLALVKEVLDDVVDEVFESTKPPSKRFKVAAEQRPGQGAEPDMNRNTTTLSSPSPDRSPNDTGWGMATDSIQEPESGTVFGFIDTIIT